MSFSLFIYYIGVNFMFGLLCWYFVRYHADNFTVSLAGLKNIVVCYTEDFVIKGFVLSGFHRKLNCSPNKKTRLSLQLRPNLTVTRWVSVKPGTAPEHPGTPPEHPGTSPERPRNSPEQPGTTPEHPWNIP